MDLTDNHDMVIPIFAACLLARGAASLFCPTPVYKDFAERMVQDFEKQQAAQAATTEQERVAAEAMQPVGNTTAFDEPSGPVADEPEADADESADDELTVDDPVAKLPTDDTSPGHLPKER
jgi:hypothetical protein